MSAPGWWTTAATGDRLLLLLLAAIGVVLLLTLALAARVLVARVRRVRRVRRRRLRAARWTPVLLDVLSGDAAPEKLHARVRPRERLQLVDFLAAYARRVRGAERAQLCALAQPYLPALAQRVRRRSAAVRARAVRTLGILGLPQYGPVLVGALNDPDEEVAAFAALALARREHPERAPAVLDRLELLERWDRSFVAGLLAAVGPGMAEPLRRLLADPRRSPRLRADAADALAELCDLPAAELAAEVLAGAVDRELAAGCLRLLARVGVARHAPAARARLDDPDPLLRAHAAATLGHLGGRADVDALAVWTADRDPWVALRAAEALHRLHADDVLLAMAEGAEPLPVAAGAGPVSPTAGAQRSAVLAREVLAQVHP